MFYTPVEIAEWIVGQTYGPLLADWEGNDPPPRILDPACGAGVFLQAAQRALEARCRERGLSARQLEVAAHDALHGIDIDADSVTTAREQTGLPAANIRCANSLADEVSASFAAIVGNPPYVSIRELAKNHSPKQVTDLRRRFHSARGNFDLYVLFVERALQWLQPGGRLGFIIPNKWATLDYARPLRELLLRDTIEQIVDLSSLRVFPRAGTYPQIIVLERRPAAAGQRVKLSSGLDGTDSTRWLDQSDLRSEAFVLGDEIRVEHRVETKTLASVATLHSGASGYSAQQLSESLKELHDATSDRGDLADFIVSGNIDRYTIQKENVRFLKQTWQRPVIALDEEQITPLKRKLYREPKLVFSGMSRRLKVAYDEQGCALGVQVYATAEMQLDPFYLLGVLNSKLLSYLFRERFAAKRLAGGYLSINKGQLAQLPICVSNDRQEEKWQRQIANLARHLHLSWSAALDEQLDAAVYQLYEITVAERERIETSFVEPGESTQRNRAA